jgi:hypothetical protein
VRPGAVFSSVVSTIVGALSDASFELSLLTRAGACGGAAIAKWVMANRCTHTIR